MTNKVSTGLKGLDQILDGGYPGAVPTLLKGSPGTGKTLFSLSFVNQRLLMGESVVLVTCDESPERLRLHMTELGFLVQEPGERLSILDFRPDVYETVVGAFDLAPILLRIANAIERSGARSLVIDSLQNLLLGLAIKMPDRELLKIFDWLRAQGVTTLVTAAKSADERHKDVLEEYAVDCVIHLQQRVADHLMTRYLRVVKLRGSSHGTNEYPFSFHKSGISILPITASRLQGHEGASRLSSGLKTLDQMLGGEGYWQGSVLMISGRSGSGKSILAASLMHAALDQGLRGVYVTFEESEQDFIRNLGSVGLDLTAAIATQQLQLHAVRPVEKGMEEHLIGILDLLERVRPQILVLDPISSLVEMGSAQQVKMLLIRFVSHIKSMGVTLLVTELLPDGSRDYSELAISSLTDSWIRLRQVENNGELNRLINVVKSRGNASSNQVKEFLITGQGIHIEEPYVGEGMLLVGTAKAGQMQLDQEMIARRGYELERLRRLLDDLEQSLAAKQQLLLTEFDSERDRLGREMTELQRQLETLETRQSQLKRMRTE
ncbi:MAG: circadian clock protein KaiC [Gammaproteobacteria bacterium SHHR-1]|nr:circadian clock protein KaiC [gamma proteobacterium SS-5]